MTDPPLYQIAGVVLFGIGLFRLATTTQILRLLLALNIMGTGTFLVLIGAAVRNRTGAPDPIPHAMVLTGIVVTMGVSAFATALLRRMHATTGQQHLTAPFAFPEDESP